MLRRAWVKIVVFVLCLVPAIYLGWCFYQQDLTANPLEYITHFTGDWALRLIVVTLAVTPLRKVLGLPDLIRFRRMIGLFAFFYASLHFLAYLWLDRLFDFQDLAKDIAKRPFITIGFVSFVLMLPLAITSTKGWIRRLSGRRWQMLHRLVYFAAIAAVIHYYWLVKSDVRQPLLYATLVGVLLLFRAATWIRARAFGARPAGRGLIAPES
jgi:methionine sulfoxide reductase heme-binding subunit